MLWHEILTKAERTRISDKTAFREEVQKAVLTVLSQKRCFDSIVFQGGTALRLFHGNPRFSDDIDLVLREGQESYDLSPNLPYMERFVLDNYPFLDSVVSSVGKDARGLQRCVLRTNSHRSAQNLRLHIELASIPSYRNQPRILDFPAIQPAVRVEDAVEILADKVCALALRTYVKGRDLWDIHYLTKERGVEIDWDLVQLKIADYGQEVSKLTDRLEMVAERIRGEGRAIIASELERFLPRHVLDQYRPFGRVLESVLSLLSREGEQGGPGPEDE